MPQEVYKLPPNIINLANCVLIGEHGQEVKIYHLWNKQTCVFIFLRHFACIGCRAHASQIWNDRQKYEAGGARIVFIGNGSPDFIKKFKEDLNIKDAPVFTDPSLASFRAAGFKRGFLSAMGVKAIANGIKLMIQTKKGTGVEKGAGDLWQLGGVLVVKTDGRVAYHYISEVLGDYPPENDLIGIT